MTHGIGGAGWRRDLADIRQNHASAVADIRERMTPVTEKPSVPVADLEPVDALWAGAILIPAHVDTRRGLVEPVQETDQARPRGSWLV